MAVILKEVQMTDLIFPMAPPGFLGAPGGNAAADMTFVKRRFEIFQFQS